MEELRYAMDNRIGKVVIDSFDEIDKIEQLYAVTKLQQALVQVTQCSSLYSQIRNYRRSRF